MKKKLRGFTLIEVIVVIAIIGILAAILIPSMLGYVKQGRMRQFCSNAKTVHSGAQLAIVDMVNQQQDVLPNEIYFSMGPGDGRCIAQSDNTSICDISDYIGENFDGYFGFYTDQEGTGAVYALWSDSSSLNAGNFMSFAADASGHMTLDEVKATFSGGTLPVGCHPALN